MLSDVDAKQMGLGLIQDLRVRLAEARADRGDSAEQVQRVLSEFDEWMAGVNVTDAAVGILGREHPETLGSMAGLGALYLNVGRYDLAALLLRELVRLRRRMLGDDHPDTLDSKRNLAVLYEEQGRYDEAESLFRDVLEGRQRVLAEDHPDLLTSQDDVARMLRAKDRFIPTDQYETRSIEGWTVHVDRDLLAEGTELGDKVLSLPETKLDEVAQVVPESACEKLRRVPIWLGVDHGNGPTYHPSSQ
jgi:tetratricopeptide (TPR) repeat protein